MDPVGMPGTAMVAEPCDLVRGAAAEAVEIATEGPDALVVGMAAAVVVGGAGGVERTMAVAGTSLTQRSGI